MAVLVLSMSVFDLLKSLPCRLTGLCDLPIAVSQGDKPGLEGRRGKVNAPFEHGMEETIETGHVGGLCRVQVADRTLGKENPDHPPKKRDLERNPHLLRGIPKALGQGPCRGI